MERVWVFCDGSAGNNELAGRGGPSAVTERRLKPVGACGAAAVARDEQGQIVGWRWQPLAPMTNNEAEYAGLLLGLKLAQQLGARQVICVLDSNVVVGQVLGRFAVHSARLRHWHWQVCALLRELPLVQLCVAPREWNQLADALASEACVPWAKRREAIGKGEG